MMPTNASTAQAKPAHWGGHISPFDGVLYQVDNPVVIERLRHRFAIERTMALLPMRALFRSYDGGYIAMSLTPNQARAFMARAGFVFEMPAPDAGELQEAS